jgi:hypothetical protein
MDVRYLFIHLVQIATGVGRELMVTKMFAMVRIRLDKYAVRRDAVGIPQFAQLRKTLSTLFKMFIGGKQFIGGQPPVQVRPDVLI